MTVTIAEQKMSNSVVKVTDPHKNDSLILVVGEDGTVTPDKDTVESYLNSRVGPTELQVMHVNKMDGSNIDVTVDTLMYIHNEGENEEIVTEIIDTTNIDNMNIVSRNLKSFRMDHDYTPLTSPKSSPAHREPTISEIDDELAKTLRILEGDDMVEEEQPALVVVNQYQATPKGKQSLPQVIIKTPLNQTLKATPKRAPTTKLTQKAKMINTNVATAKTPAKRGSVRVIPAKVKVPPPVPPPVEESEEEDDDEDYMDPLDDFEDDLDDSDYEIEEDLPARSSARNRGGKRNKAMDIEKRKSVPKRPKTPKTPVTPKNEAIKPEIVETPKVVEEEPTPPPTEMKSAEKKLPKKEKKPPKPVIDDFCLFSTPDIMKRVGGNKEPTTPTTPEMAKTPKPAKVTPENRSKSGSSMEKTVNKNRISQPERRHSHTEKRRDSDRRTSLSEPKKAETTPSTSFPVTDLPTEVPQLEALPNLEDINNIIHGNTSENNLDLPDQTNMNLDSGGLDIDPTILDNINSELISDDILYQVAKSLVDNTELQNVIDKSISDGNLVLDPSMQQAFNENVLPVTAVETPIKAAETPNAKQVYRGGRLITIPPIERPATRSRNKKLDGEKTQPKALKPLDDDHVFGSELESSEEEEDDEEDGDEDEDDPNKLWCICNTPHNNRFMICCDLCEEWYHGKCVNVTKAMGQNMEQEGREWICLYCKDKSLTRPMAAARRIRKASRTSTDSQGSSKRSSISVANEPAGSDTQCIVCGNPSRNSSIYCSDVCIQKHAQGFKRSVVINRKTGKCLTGADAPSEAELKDWLAKNPGWEVLRSNKQGVRTTLTQSKLKVVRNANDEGVSLAVQKKGVNIGVLHHAPKLVDTAKVTPQKKIITVKVHSKQTPSPQLKQIKLIQAQPKTTPTTTPVKLKPLPAAPKLTPPAPKPSPKENKPVPVKTPKARQAETPVKRGQKEENIRDNVKKTLLEQLSNRVKLAEGFNLAEDEINKISVEIESQLFKCFGDTGQKYRNKYRSLMFNIKDTKNETLWRRICEKSVNPYQLVRLSPDDLASQELALWREREAKHTLDMIKKSELESLNYNRQMVFKTHKGEQVFEDDRPAEKVDNVDIIANLGADPTESINDNKDKKDSKDGDKKNSKHKHHRSRSKDRSRSRERGKSHDKSKDHKSSTHKDHKRDRSRSKDRRKRSRSRDRSRHSERKRSRSRDRYRRSTHKSSKNKKENHNTTEKLDNRSKEILDKLVDNRILPPLEDRLWKHVPQDDIVPTPTVESDSDHEPSSTVTIPTPPRSIDQDEVSSQTTDADKTESKKKVKETEDGASSPPPKPEKSKAEIVWRGSINMVDVAETSIVAEEVSGDCSGLTDELPLSLEVVGRIAPEIVWDYIGKMKSSNSKTISLVRLSAKNIEEKMPYLALYTYLSSRNRLGVVKSNHKAIKDFYIHPLGLKQPIPQALLPINGPGFEEDRPPLLLGIIVRDRRKRPILEGLPQVSSKRSKAEVISTPATPPARSYTPPPSRDPRLKLPGPSPSLPIPDVSTPKAVPAVPSPQDPENDEDAPYSPEDSDPDSTIPPPENTSTSFLDLSAQAFEPFTNKFDTIPGLDASCSQEIEKKIGELDEGINQCQAEINSLINNKYIANSDLGQSALANINIPSNLQQILENIKTISKTDATPEYTPAPASAKSSSDLTIPLMLPKISSRSSISRQDSASSSPTIPLNLPKAKSKSSPVVYSTESHDKGSGVLSSLSEEDLIRKAAEMLGEPSTASEPTYRPSAIPSSAPASKRPKIDLNLLPVPGKDGDT